MTEISGLIHTLNEEHDLPYALRSLRPWVDEIVVVDMHSDDRTVEIAESFGARVIVHDRIGFADPARPFGVAQCRGDWIMMLDADELVPEPLSRRLREIASSGRYDAVETSRANYLLGRPLRATGWGLDQDRHIRFFRPRAVTFSPDIHAFMVPTPGARIVRLEADERLSVIHHNYVDLADFVDRLNRYTTIEAQQATQRGERATPVVALRRVFFEFGRRYIRAQGYRDGWRGFYLSALMACYRFVSAAKQHEARVTGGDAAVRESYRRDAERWLAGYGGSEDVV